MAAFQTFLLSFYADQRHYAAFIYAKIEQYLRLSHGYDGNVTLSELGSWENPEHLALPEVSRKTG